MEEARDAYRQKRREHLELISLSLNFYSISHGEELPESLSELGNELSFVPEAAGLEYVYRSGEAGEYIVLEPEIDEVRYAVSSDGEVVEWSGE
jgi:hypothetical protein